ncbi:MAG: hypothetical protein KAG97_05910 [Victivallales bacterium]|nr:hypothetical protein [Victivallales bacterium]
MIPSDHFIRFYNEVFKFLSDESEEDLRAFWLDISHLQESLTGALFKEKGFEGMKEYYDKIIREENLDAEASVKPDHFEMVIHSCSSLRKAMDNDAGMFPRYCDHCAGWLGPMCARLGFYFIMDIESRIEPHCRGMIFKEKAKRDAMIAKCKLPLMNDEAYTGEGSGVGKKR